MRWKLIVALVLVVLLAGCGGANTDSSGSTSGSDQAGQYSVDYDTDPVVLRLSDLPRPFEQSGETTQSTRDSDSLEGGLEVLHSRYFSRSSSAEDEGPETVISTVRIYEDVGTAEEYIRGTSDIERGTDVTVEEIQVASGITGKKVTYTNELGRVNTIIHGRDENLVYSITVADDSENGGFATEYFLKMVSQI
jgi:hypothetical protein